MSEGADPLRAALATGLLASEEAHRELLDSIVEVARAIFGAQASSIMLHDLESGRLVFEAVAGEGADRLVGSGFPAGQGLAGWVLASGQAVVLEDVGADPRFARDVAERSGYVPKGLMAAPLEGRDRVLGVLQVLDRPQRSRFSLQEMDLLGLFAAQAAVALEIVEAARAGRRAMDADQGQGGAVGRLAAALSALDPEERARADAVLDAVAGLLENR